MFWDCILGVFQLSTDLHNSTKIHDHHAYLSSNSIEDENEVRRMIERTTVSVHTYPTTSTAYTTTPSRSTTSTVQVAQPGSQQPLFGPVESVAINRSPEPIFSVIQKTMTSMGADGSGKASKITAKPFIGTSVVSANPPEYAARTVAHHMPGFYTWNQTSALQRKSAQQFSPLPPTQPPLAALPLGGGPTPVTVAQPGFTAFPFYPAGFAHTDMSPPGPVDEVRGCAWDIVTNSCRDLFLLKLCSQCHDFGNIFLHNCKCIAHASSSSFRLA